MRVGFDLDGTLDRPAVRDLALALLKGGHQVYVITGCFLEAGPWQDEDAKFVKLARLGLIKATLDDGYEGYDVPENLHVMVLPAVDHKEFDRDYRLADLGLRKGAYISQMGIEVMFDDSELYCKMMPSMCGAQIVQVLR